MCDRCAELQDEIDFLRGELGMLAKIGQVTRLASIFGLTKMEAYALQALYTARRQPLVTYGALSDGLEGASPSREEKDYDRARTFVFRVRRALGDPGMIENVRGLGYRLSPVGIAKYESAMEP